MPKVSDTTLFAAVMDTDLGDMRTLITKDPRLFYNISTLSSMFICGSQGMTEPVISPTGLISSTRTLLVFSRTIL